MKLKYKILISGISCSLMIGVYSCKREKIDPCEGKNRTSADFKINSTIEYYDINRNSQTITKEVNTLLTGTYAEFTATHDYKSYQYVIGTDPKVWTGKSFYLSFDNPESSIPITLVVENDKPDISCFPGDPGYDTLTKDFKVIEYTDWPLYGEYKGYFNDDPNTEKIVKVLLEGIEGLSWYEDTTCSMSGKTGQYAITEYNSQRAIFGCAFTTSGCYTPTGVLLVENDNIIINYHLRGLKSLNNLERVNRKFTGKKIN